MGYPPGPMGYPCFGREPGCIGSWGALGIVLEASWDRLGGLLGGLRPRKVANMGPTWLPKRSKNRWKIGPKIDQFYDASWNRYFSMIFGSKNRAMLDRNCIPTSILSYKGLKAEKYNKTNISLIRSEVSGIEKSNKNRSKIDKKWRQDDIPWPFWLKTS